MHWQIIRKPSVTKACCFFLQCRIRGEVETGARVVTVEEVEPGARATTDMSRAYDVRNLLGKGRECLEEY